MTRSYRQRCVLAYGADLLGDRWTLLIVRELLIQPCRFRDLARFLDGIGTNLLSRRLQDLGDAGLLERESDTPRSAYRLSRHGLELEPAVLALVRWSYRHFELAAADAHWPHWDLLPLKAFFDASRCQRSLVVQFTSDAFTAWVRTSADGFEHGIGEHEAPDLTLPWTIAELQQALQQDGRVSGDLRAFAQCFDVPARHVRI